MLTGLYQYASMALAKTYTALTKLVAIPIVAEVVMFFNISAFGLALAWLATVWATARLAGRRIWDAALVAALADADLPDLHELRRAGNGFRGRRDAGVGAAKTGAGGRADRPRRGRQAVSGCCCCMPLVVLGVRTGRLREVGQDRGDRRADVAAGESAGDGAVPARVVGVLPAQHPSR